MSFPLIFNTGKQSGYMDKKEWKLLQRFIAVLPELSVEYHKGSGANKEIRMPQKYRYPLGAVTPYTKFLPNKTQDGTRDYTTPLAELEFQPGDVKQAKVWWKDVATGEGSIITAEEWIAWQEGAVVKGKPKQVVSKEAQTRFTELKIRHTAADMEAPVNFAHPPKKEK